MPDGVAINVDIGEFTLWTGIVLIVLIAIRTSPQLIRATAELVRAHKEQPPPAGDRPSPRALDAPSE